MFPHPCENELSKNLKDEKMEKFSIAVVFDHRRRTKDGKEGPLEVRVTIQRKHYFISTGIHVREKDWAGAVVHRADSDALNDRLGLIVQATTKAVTDWQRQNPGKAVDMDAVKRHVFSEPGREEKDAMLKWLTKEVPKLKIKDTTRRRYDVLINRLEKYDGLRQWSDLTVERLYDFDRWLHNIEKAQSNGDRQAGVEPKKIGDSAVYNYHRTLRALLSRAVKLGVIETNPYERVRGEFRKGVTENVEYLSEDEIAAIESLHPMAGTQMAMARDLFVFQMYTGLSYSDSQAFDIGNYKKTAIISQRTGQKEWRWVHTGKRIKTGVAYVSDLLPQAVDVLERYGMQVPKVGNVQYNESLKVIQKALGIRTRLHSHLARHTFATRMLAYGAKLENVSKALGHTNTRQTERYAKVLAESVHNDYTMFEEKLKNAAKGG